MGNTDKKKSKKFNRKIRIKLADPSIPDSYICEIFDSSLETEDEEFSNEISRKGKTDSSKPKNYFELLMSGNCKKNTGISTSLEDKNDTNSDDDSDDDAIFLRRKQKSVRRNRNAVVQSVNKKNKIKNVLESVDIENHFQIPKNSKSEIAKQENKQNQNGEPETKTEDVTLCVSPKLEVPGKKTLSILNYFSKAKSVSNNLSAERLTENSMTELSISQAENNIKNNNNNKSDLGNLCLNSAQKLLVNGVNKQGVKLAPLFCKKNSKSVDLERQKARQEFLHSALPSSIKKPETKPAESIFHFPKVTHVQQRNESVHWSVREIFLPLPKISHSEFAFNQNKKFTIGIKPIKNNFVKPDSELKCSVNFTKEDLCRKKCNYSELELESVIDSLKEKKDRFSARVKKIENSKKGCGKNLTEELPYEELNVLWSEKYKPKSSEILGNVNTVRKLRKWLQSWKTFNNELKALANSNQDLKKSRNRTNDNEFLDFSSDDDDFLDLSSENYGLKSPGNVCIISGPNGCGKTALVYALATELEFGVLELNASSKRTGKKVLSDLQEATQSHKVHSVNSPQNLFLNFDKKKKKGQRAKKNKKKTIKSEETNDSKMSLILIEDSDIVFDDHDEGFYSAITSLVQTSKRPLIFIANDSHCLFMENFKQDQCLILEMEPPDFYKSCAVLDVVSSLEGVQFETEELNFLLRHNKFDFRKCLLELQFWSASGRKIDEMPNRKIFSDLGHLWWGSSKFLFNQDMRHSGKPISRKRKRAENFFDSSDEEEETAAKKFKSDPETRESFRPMKADAVVKTSDSQMESYYGILDLLSVVDGFCESGTVEPIPGFECRPKDSLTLEENMEETPWGRGLTKDLSEEMINLSARIFKRRLKENENSDRKLYFESPSWEEIRWRNSQRKVTEEFSGLISLTRGRDKRGLHLDYLPILRNICRVERHRWEINPKRKNRFYHYLNNFKPDLSDEILEINCETFDR